MDGVVAGRGVGRLRDERWRLINEWSENILRQELNSVSVSVYLCLCLCVCLSLSLSLSLKQPASKL